MRSDYKSSIAQVSCENEKGTAFLIEPQKAITARHTIVDYWEGNKINLYFPNLKQKLIVEAKVIYPKGPYHGVNIDIAILELVEPIYTVLPLTLCTLPIQPKDNWTAYGYSTTKWDIGEVFSGTITQILSDGWKDGKYDLDLACSHPIIIDTNYITKGASGSPIFVGDKVIGVLSDKIPGGSIGGVSIRSCSGILEKELSFFTHPESKAEYSFLNDPPSIDSNVSVKKLVLTPLQKKIIEAKETVVNLIEDFPADAHSMMYQALNDVIKEILNINPYMFEMYLQSYRFPFAFNHSEDIGVEQLIEILTLIKLQFPNLQLVHNDQTANLFIDEQLDLFINVIYAVKRHTKMPEIILEMARKILQTPTGRKAIARGDQILPYPLIFDNCSGHKKVNLCKNCQSEFSFNNIIKDYCSEDDDGYFTGIEQNNFGLLQETKVLCANCMRDLHNEVTDINQLLQRIKELIA